MPIEVEQDVEGDDSSPYWGSGGMAPGKMFWADVLQEDGREFRREDGNEVA